jgi:hypothetical protein
LKNHQNFKGNIEHSQPLANDFAKAPNKITPNYRTKSRQITEQNSAKLPNKLTPNYRIN